MSSVIETKKNADNNIYHNHEHHLWTGVNITSTTNNTKTILGFLFKTIKTIVKSNDNKNY